MTAPLVCSSGLKLCLLGYCISSLGLGYAYVPYILLGDPFLTSRDPFLADLFFFFTILLLGKTSIVTTLVF